MNIFQKIASWFGKQYVVLFYTEDLAQIHPTRKLGYAGWFVRLEGEFFCRECKLLPYGEIRGQVSIKQWEPITKHIHNYYRGGD